MQQRWRHFRRLVLATTGAIWVLWCSGVLLLADVNLISRIALLLMLLLCTGVAIYLTFAAGRESKNLERQTIEARAPRLQEEFDRSGPGHSGAGK